MPAQKKQNAKLQALQKQKDIKGVIIGITGPLIIASGEELFMHIRLYDTVRVGSEKLLGEVIKISDSKIYAQVYEDTSGLMCGDPVYLGNGQLSVLLGPGLLGGIFDGIQRPLQSLIDQSNSPFITRGVDIEAVDRKKEWTFEPQVRVGDKVVSGDIVGTVPETEKTLHKVLVPYGVSGEVISVHKGKADGYSAVVKIKNGDTEHSVGLYHLWPVRQPRPVAQKISVYEPLLTGQRVIDTFFPIMKGGTGTLPGPFGSGKTVTQHQFAKWSDADIIVFVGCGERGNEMTDVLEEFPTLKDPRSGRPLMERTVLIANTSNMPVAAREASIYVGVTIAEYFRDQGFDVAVMADSTSRWAEALREISGRLEETPGEEGYPPYLGSRTAAFYERAGKVYTLGQSSREASITIVGAVSPAGGDLSEPVTTNTLRVAKVFWGLDASLAYKRHYPAINWLTSYSLYGNDLNPWFAKNVHAHFPEWKKEAQSLLQRESKLEELVRLVGIEALSATEQFLLMVTRSLREDYLQQIAFDEIDSYCAPQKQALMLGWIMSWFHEGTARILEEGVEALNVLRQDQFWVAYGRAKQRSFEDLLNEELIPVSLRSEFKH